MKRILIGFLYACVLLVPVHAAAQEQIFNARGFPQDHETFSQLPCEHIDPLTGNLLLTFTDLVLPGNAGFDLRIQRTYNSKIYAGYTTFGEILRDNSWVGIG
jgi:hypothetical protein